MRRVLLLIVAALPVILCGCMQLRITVSLERDGGGAYALTYSVADDIQQDLAALSDMGSRSGASGFAAPDPIKLDEDEFRRVCAEQDVQIKRFDRNSSDGVRSLDLALEYPRTEALATALKSLLGPDCAVPSLTRTADGNYILRMLRDETDAGPDLSAAELHAEAAGSMAALDSGAIAEIAETSARLVRASADLLISFRIRVPGRILDHNAHRIEDGACVWELNAGNITHADSLSPLVVFSGKGLDLVAPTAD